MIIIILLYVHNIIIIICVGLHKKNIAQVVSIRSSCPIVIPSWLEAASQCFSEVKALPCPADYQPEVVDTNLDEGEVSFRPDFRRRILFQDRTIYFLCNN